MMFPVYMGEVTHVLKDGSVRHFKPTGPIYIFKKDGTTVAAREAKKNARQNPFEPFPPGGLTARLFVGLSVGDIPRFTVDDVIGEVRTFAKVHGGNASFVVQRGIYHDRPEDSVQVVIIDEKGRPLDVFLSEMTEMAEGLANRFEQEAVILEIQRSGVVQTVGTVTA
jgi:hypothetical protein